jgi:hypothetical protein
MLSHLRPSLFYGTSIAALCGLALGLMAHGPWASHEGGPQILFASAAAAELARPLSDADIVQAGAYDPSAEQTAAYADNTLADTSQLPADPLPVVRLNHINGTALPAAKTVERVAKDEVATDVPLAVEAVKDEIPPDQPPRAPVSYTHVASTSAPPSDF